MEQIVAALPFIVPVVVAIIALLANKLIKPAAYNDLWAENRALRDDHDDLRREFEEYRRAQQDRDETHRRERAADHLAFGILGDGFDALVARVRQLETAIRSGATEVPELTSEVEDLIERARSVRAG